MSVSVHFLYFLFKCKGVKPTSMSNKICKYVENEISNSTSHKNKKQKKREREEQRHIQLEKHQF